MKGPHNPLSIPRRAWPTYFMGLGSVGAERERGNEVVWLMFLGLELWGQPIEGDKHRE